MGVFYYAEFIFCIASVRQELETRENADDPYFIERILSALTWISWFMQTILILGPAPAPTVHPTRRWPAVDLL